ncbi:DEAD/DEAH box helicase [Luteimonas dalianensis]|uniref:DEAD/DEAH box helicase n=1 Tax=Luteimonas dalianensis TaxID=1148196 RepID=UPI003BF40FA9
MELKDYQKRTLKRLGLFLAQARVEGPAAAFDATVEVQDDETPPTYRPILNEHKNPVPSLESVPYVALRIPTGGGKTVLGAHIIRQAARIYLERELPLVLWLVPSRQIKDQTLEAFRNPRHPYRRELDAAFGVGKVSVFDIADNAQIRPQDLADNLCLVIGTMASARVADTDLRDFYADKEALEPHFIKLATLEGLTMKDGAARPNFSFANLLKMHRPLVITDEAHNANTRLSYEVYERLSPSAIVELTATPDWAASNVLVRVSASELKAEQMIKLPVVLKEHTDGWEECLQAALQRRAYLGTLAPGEAPDYLRPILLIQAENKNLEATVEVVHDHLVNNENIPAEHIVVATGDQRGLDDVDLFDPDCPVRVIITKDALKEGWDCSFAYVLCSLTQQRSGTAIEQLLGRVLRMPYARERKNDELNKAYAHVVSRAFGEVAQELTDELERMGFNPVEAAQAIEQGTIELKGGEGGALAPQTLILSLPSAPDLTNVPAADRERIQVEGGKDKQGVVVTVNGVIDEATQEALVETLPKRQRAEAKKRLVHHNVRAAAVRETPAQKQQAFAVPRLMFQQGKLTLEVSADLLLDLHGWNLLDHPADLSSYRYNEATRTYLVDLDGKEVGWEKVDEPQAAYVQGLAGEWSERELVDFLDRRVRQIDVTQEKLVEWVRRAVSTLMTRGYDLAQLVRGKYVIARKLEEQIELARQNAAASTYQDTLFANDAPVLASFAHAYTFDPNAYPMRYPCAANYRWKKHYYAVPGDLPHKRKDGSLAEEFQCAIELDQLDAVEFWVRNLVHPSQFWLPTATGRTYPDFVAKLKDGRLLVVEYKGGDRVSNDDSQAKAQMGHLWQKASQGQGLYLMATKSQEGLSVGEQLARVVQSSTQ